MNSKSERGSRAPTLGPRRKGTWFCELAVVATLLTSQGMMPAARAEEPPPASSQGCIVEDPLDSRSQDCPREGDTTRDCAEPGVTVEPERGTGRPVDPEYETEDHGGATGQEGEDSESREDDGDHDARDQEVREESGEDGPDVDEGRAARKGDPGSEEAGSCETPADASPAGEPEEAAGEPTGDRSEPGGEPGEESATEPGGENESGEPLSSERPGDDHAPEETPDESPWGGAPVVPDDSGGLDPDEPAADPPGEGPSVDCTPRHVLLDCSPGLGRVPGGGRSGEGDKKDVERRRPAPPGPGSERPAPAAGLDDAPAAVPASWRPTGALSTAALTDALIEDHGKIAPEDYAPFIIAGRASWVDTWGAPRFGPGAVVRRHEGQDVFCDYGAPVLASEDGIVEFDAGGLGGRVARVHRLDGAYWYYAHLSRWNTDELDSGDAVAPGDVIGYCGNSGNAATSPPHVHFGLYGPDGRAADPMPWLVRWLRAAERSAGLRRLSEAPDPSSTDVAGLLRDGSSTVTTSPRPIRSAAIGRFDASGDAPQSLRGAGIAPVMATRPPTRPSLGHTALEFVGLGALLATAFLMRARARDDRAEATPTAQRRLPKGGHSGR